MKIVRIFEGRLYAVKETEQHELRRLMGQWQDFGYVYRFLSQHKDDLPPNIPLEQLAETIIDNAFYIKDTLKKIATTQNARFEVFFRPLNNHEYQLRKLAEQKGRENYLRIYAIKIDDDCFLITGGAIKFTHFMQERDHTKIELEKIKRYRDYLIANNVFDLTSFDELLSENK